VAYQDRPLLNDVVEHAEEIARQVSRHRMPPGSELREPVGEHHERSLAPVLKAELDAIRGDDPLSDVHASLPWPVRRRPYGMVTAVAN